MIESDPGPRELGEEPPEVFPEGEVRGDGPGGLRRHERSVDGVASRPPVEDVDDLGGDLLGDPDLGLGRRGAEMRGEEGVRRVEER